MSPVKLFELSWGHNHLNIAVHKLVSQEGYEQKKKQSIVSIQTAISGVDLVQPHGR